MSACLFGKHLPPPEARCNPHAERSTDAFSQVLIGLIMVQVLPAIPPEGKFLESSLEFSLREPSVFLWVGWLLSGFPSSVSSGVRQIALDSLNRL